MILLSGQANRKSCEGKRGDSRSWQISPLIPNLSPFLSQRAAQIPEAEAGGEDGVRLLYEDFSEAWALCWSSRIPSLSSFLRPWDLQVDLGLEAEARSLIERVCKVLVLGGGASQVAQ